MTSEIEIGDRIRDNDPRKPNRILKITWVGDSRVRARDWCGNSVSLQLRRIYTDGKARKGGFSLVDERQGEQ